MDTTEKILNILSREKEKSITELAEQLNVSRQAVWKILKNILKKNMVLEKEINTKKTSARLLKLNFKDIVLKKTIELILTKQASENKRWQDTFMEISFLCNFTILFGSILQDSKNAKDIDILIIANKKKFNKIESSLSNIQKTLSKEIHFIQLTEQELKNELKNSNKAYLDALRKGVILYGQENFVEFMEKLNGN